VGWAILADTPPCMHLCCIGAGHEELTCLLWIKVQDKVESRQGSCSCRIKCGSGRDILSVIRCSLLGTWSTRPGQPGPSSGQSTGSLSLAESTDVDFLPPAGPAGPMQGAKPPCWNYHARPSGTLYMSYRGPAVGQREGYLLVIRRPFCLFASSSPRKPDLPFPFPFPLASPLPFPNSSSRLLMALSHIILSISPPAVCRRRVLILILLLNPI